MNLCTSTHRIPLFNAYLHRLCSWPLTVAAFITCDEPKKVGSWGMSLNKRRQTFSHVENSCDICQRRKHIARSWINVGLTCALRCAGGTFVWRSNIRKGEKRREENLLCLRNMTIRIRRLLCIWNFRSSIHRGCHERGKAVSVAMGNEELGYEVEGHESLYIGFGM